MAIYDVAIVGAGVTGSAVARELSRRKGRFVVLERALDVCEGTSKANSAIMHAGFDAEPGTMKAKMNVRGNQMMDQLSGELDIPFRRVGAFVVCFSKEELPKLQELYDRGVANGVSGMELLTGEQARALEPNLSEEVEGALLAHTSGIVCPFELTLGLAESAAKNGVEFSFDTQVTGLEPGEEGWVVHTSRGDYAARAVVNAAGVFADEVLPAGPHRRGPCVPHGVPIAREIRQGGAGLPHGPRQPAAGPHRQGYRQPGGHRHHRPGASGGAGEIRPGGEEHPHPAGGPTRTGMTSSWGRAPLASSTRRASSPRD